MRETTVMSRQALEDADLSLSPAEKREAMLGSAQRYLDGCLQRDFDTLGRSAADGKCYECKSEDVPARGAVDSYTAILDRRGYSQTALVWLVDSMAKGFSYSWD